MSDTKETKPTKPLTLSGTGKLELKSKTEQGLVRQKFSHGRTKAVTVEVKKKRVPAAGGASAAPAAPAAAPAKAAEAAEAEAPARRSARTLGGTALRALIIFCAWSIAKRETCSVMGWRSAS